MVADRYSEQSPEELQKQSLSFNPKGTKDQESAWEQSDQQHPSPEKAPYKAIRSILRGMQARQQEANPIESIEQKSNLDGNLDQNDEEVPDFSRNAIGFDSESEDQVNSSVNNEEQDDFSRKSHGLIPPQVNTNLYSPDFNSQGDNNHNSSPSPLSGIKMNLFSNSPLKERVSDQKRDSNSQNQPFQSPFGPVRKNSEQNRLFPEEIPNSFQKSLFKQNVGNEFNSSSQLNQGYSDNTPPSWEDQTRILLKGRSIQSIARHQGELSENPSNFLHSSHHNRVSIEEMPDFRPPPPKLPPQPHQNGGLNRSDQVNPQDMLFKSPNGQRMSYQFSHDLKEYSRLGLKHALPPPPKLPPVDHSKNQKKVHTEPTFTINAPNLRGANNISGNLSCAGLHSVNWFCNRPSSLANVNLPPNSQSNQQGNNIQHFGNPVERESHMLEILQRIQGRDMLRFIVLQALRNGQPHFESELHRLVKEKKPQLGSVAFGLIMYSLVEMFGRDMIRMEEDSRGKLYSLSDEFKRVCDLGLTT